MHIEHVIYCTSSPLTILLSTPTLLFTSPYSPPLLFLLTSPLPPTPLPLPTLLLSSPHSPPPFFTLSFPLPTHLLPFPHSPLFLSSLTSSSLPTHLLTPSHSFLSPLSSPLPTHLPSLLFPLPSQPLPTLLTSPHSSPPLFH